MKQRPLWRCKKCGRYFANRNQSHACGPHDLEQHLSGKPQRYERLRPVIAAIRALGPVRIFQRRLVSRSRDACHSRLKLRGQIGLMAMLCSHDDSSIPASARCRLSSRAIMFTPLGLPHAVTWTRSFARGSQKHTLLASSVTPEAGLTRSIDPWNHSLRRRVKIRDMAFTAS